MTNKSNDKSGMFEPVLAKHLEVRIEECGGDTEKLIKRFIKKVKKEEVLKEWFQKNMCFETKSQKVRRKKRQAVFNNLLKKDE